MRGFVKGLLAGVLAAGIMAGMAYAGAEGDRTGETAGTATAVTWVTAEAAAAGTEGVVVGEDDGTVRDKVSPGTIVETDPAGTDMPQAGSIVTFGRYEQDGNTSNGPEDIEWIVLEAQEEKCLLISRYTLDAKPYHEEYKGITWEKCTLREWLNGTFLKKAFTEEEREAILLTKVENGDAQKYKGFHTDGGADTEDYLYVLSYAEAERYFTKSRERRCAPTDYAIRRGALVNEDFRAGERLSGLWWLRSPANHQYRVSVVYSSGELNYTYATKKSGGVRPVFWMGF